MTTAPNQTHVPPQNIDAEESVLGGMLVREATITPVILDVGLAEDDFYRERHRTIFRAIRNLYDRSMAVDALTVTEALVGRGELEDAGGQDFVANLAATVPSAGNAPHYARIVKQNALLRRLLEAAQTIQQDVYERGGGEPEELVEKAERLLFGVAHDGRTRDFRHVAEILEGELKKLEALSKGDQSMTGLASGFRDLDTLTGGFQKGNLIILAARPSMGKSALVANIAENVSVKGKQPVAFFSLEMSETELAQRFIACRARIPGERLRQGRVAQKDWPGVLRACNELDAAPLWIDDSSDINMLELRAKSRRLHSQELANGGKGLGLIIVDYLQLMRAEDPRANRVEQVGQISRGLKILARELEVPVIGISQLSRAPEQRPDKRPILSDLRESGQIEQDADLVGFLYRDEYYNPDTTEEPGIADVLIAKHRNGPIGNVKLVFIPQFPKFADRARDQRSAAPSASGVPDGPSTADEPPPPPPPDHGSEDDEF